MPFAAGPAETALNGFAMQRSGVRLPSSPPVNPLRPRPPARGAGVFLPRNPKPQRDRCRSGAVDWRCLGQDICKSDKAREALDILFHNPPRMGKIRDAVDPLHWHIGSLASYQGRGKFLDRWCFCVRRALPKTQQRVEEAGSWDPVANNIYLSNRESTTVHAVHALALRTRSLTGGAVRNTRRSWRGSGDE